MTETIPEPSADEITLHRIRQWAEEDGRDTAALLASEPMQAGTGMRHATSWPSSRCTGSRR